jgi:hypothetical protein
MMKRCLIGSVSADALVEEAAITEAVGETSSSASRSRHVRRGTVLKGRLREMSHLFMACLAVALGAARTRLSMMKLVYDFHQA